MTIGRESYSDFKARLAQRLSRHRTPFAGTIELTARCNFNCSHCYLNDHHEAPDGIDYAFMDRVLVNLANGGCLGVTLTGGEPLLHPDFFVIYERAHRLGFQLVVFTNGAMIDNDTAKFFQRFPPYGIEVSLYGKDDATYRRVTGRSPLVSLVWQGIDRLLERHVRVVLKTVLTRDTAPDAPHMMSMARERGIELVMDAGMTPTLSGDSRILELRCPSSLAVELEFQSHKKEALSRYVAQTRSIVGTTTMVSRCGAGYSGFHIDYRGHLMPCVMLRRITWDLHVMSFDNAWKQMAAYAPPSWPEGTICNDCELAYLCNYCPGAMDCGDPPPLKKNGFYCFIARQRMNRMTSG